eukprot:NODE_5132_length_730_cov_15.706314_g4313_i0.p2 GENE.NODE_5132_length_730_cov_15.706314_g4313_i0~~NODE_5132_length_730_cov_15.706314_g4313_i0.p2  ORF type:complete len:85 (-),score=1.05 NODE_5132_length_730_cov_15.706314_g4313_i0:474-728(-)
MGERLLRLARRQVMFLGFLHSSHRSGRRDRLLVLRLLPQSFRSVFQRLNSMGCGQGGRVRQGSPMKRPAAMIGWSKQRPKWRLV